MYLDNNVDWKSEIQKYYDFQADGESRENNSNSDLSNKTIKHKLLTKKLDTFNVSNPTNH